MIYNLIFIEVDVIELLQLLFYTKKCTETIFNSIKFVKNIVYFFKFERLFFVSWNVTLVSTILNIYLHTYLQKIYIKNIINICKYIDVVHSYLGINSLDHQLKILFIRQKGGYCGRPVVLNIHIHLTNQ